MTAAVLESSIPFGFNPHVASGSAGIDDPVGLAPYHPSWPARFRVEAEVLRVALKSLRPRLEHVGSTAVPGLAAKPTVDILLGVERPTDIDNYIGRLENFGYRGPGPYEYIAAETRFLVREVRGVRTHDVHVVEYMGDRWHRMLLFRDMLRLDPSLASDYEQLKRKLAAQFPFNRLGYSMGKAEFVQSVIGTPL